jgi:hypothetical protein
MPKASVRDLNAMILADSVDRQTIERLTVIGKIADSQRVMAKLHEFGFRIIQSGPYTDREMHPSVDMTRFKFVAEREI